MGVDYSPQWGLGYQVEIDITDEVKKSEHWDEEEEHLDAYEFFNELLEGTRFRFFETGSYYYEDEMYYFIVLDNPFDNGLDLTEKAKQLTEFLKEKGIKTLTPFDLVGGLLIH